MKTVAAFPDRVRAEHALGFLRNNRVDAIIWSDDAGGLNPAIGFVESYQLRVRDEDVGLAEELLSDFGMVSRDEDQEQRH